MWNKQNKVLNKNRNQKKTESPSQITCSWPFTLLEKLAGPHLPQSLKKESRSGLYIELLSQKKKWYLHDSISQLLATQTDKKEVCGLHSLLSLVVPHTSQANNIPVQPWKYASASLPVKSVLPTWRQKFSTCANSYYRERQYWRHRDTQNGSCCQQTGWER